MGNKERIGHRRICFKNIQSLLGSFCTLTCCDLEEIISIVCSMLSDYFNISVTFNAKLRGGKYCKWPSHTVPLHFCS